MITHPCFVIKEVIFKVILKCILILVLQEVGQLAPEKLDVLALRIRDRVGSTLLAQLRFS